MKIKTYEFPTLDDGLSAIENKVCELTKKYREDKLEPEENDFLDFANTVLDSIG